MIHKILEGLGLQPKEAKVYLAALELGSSPVSAIGSKAKINRVSTYDILEKLAKKGLVNFMIKRDIKFYTATDPALVTEEFKKRADELEKALPELKRLRGETSHPKIQYFEGLEGIKRIYADTLNSNSEILNYCNSQAIRESWPEYDTEYVQKRIEKNIQLRGIAPDDEYGKKVQAKDSYSVREIRLISKDKYNFTNEINIYDNKVSIISTKDELIGMIIESVEIANTQRALFEMIWSFANAKVSTFGSNTSAFGTAPTQAPEMTIRKVGGLKKTEKKEEVPAEDQVSLF